MAGTALDVNLNEPSPNSEQNVCVVSNTVFVYDRFGIISLDGLNRYIKKPSIWPGL